MTHRIALVVIDSAPRHAGGVGGRTAAALQRLVVVAAALLFLSALLLLSGCGSSEEPVDVFAAASLADAFDDIAAEFTAASGIDVRLNLGGSSSLREQILDGASVDVFASANEIVMEDVVAGRAGIGPRATMATNELVLAVPAANVANVTTVRDLVDDDLFVGVCAEAVPCGDLAQTYFHQVGVAPSIDTFEPDVRFVVSRLIDEELDAGMIYASDIIASDGQLSIVERANPAVTTSYPLAVADLDDHDAQAFVDFVLGPSGRRILERWGFATP